MAALMVRWKVEQMDRWKDLLTAADWDKRLDDEKAAVMVSE